MDYMEQARELIANGYHNCIPRNAVGRIAGKLEALDTERSAHEATKAELQALRERVETIAIECLQLEHVGLPESAASALRPLLPKCVTRAADALEPSGDVVERVKAALQRVHSWDGSFIVTDAQLTETEIEALATAAITSLGASHE